MRKAILGFLLASSLGLYFYLYPGFMQPALTAISDSYASFKYRRDVVTTGLRTLREPDLRLDAFYAKSNLWWLFNLSAIETYLRQNPLILSASVNTCGLFSWGCFRVQISERSPELLAKVGSEHWLVGHDGGLMLPVPDNSVDKVKASGRIRLVDGILRAESSPDVLAGRLSYVREALKTIEATSGQQVEKVSLLPNGELAVTLKGLALRAVFSRAADDNSEILRRESARLKAVLEEFKDRPDVIENVDLALRSQAVVRLKQAERAQ